MSDEPMIRPLGPRPMIDWRELMPDATHICTRCWCPLLSKDEPHPCVHSGGKQS
jgi:hypothetical protein